MRKRQFGEEHAPLIPVGHGYGRGQGRVGQGRAGTDRWGCAMAFTSKNGMSFFDQN